MSASKKKKSTAKKKSVKKGLAKAKIVAAKKSSKGTTTAATKKRKVVPAKKKGKALAPRKDPSPSRGGDSSQDVANLFAAKVQAPSDTWKALKEFTDARIALGRCGASQPTGAQLSFQLDHARARDAIYESWNRQTLSRSLSQHGLEILALKSQASNRAEYLKRPDLGRKLSDESRKALEAYRGQRDRSEGSRQSAEKALDIVFVLADGLSARAVENHGPAFLEAFLALQSGLRIGPICIVEQGRVAVGDSIGEMLDTSLVVVLIGERPGLSSPDSLGLYMTFDPRSGRTDEARNCISNIRSAGLPPKQAAGRFLYLARKALGQRLSGVALKDDWTAAMEGPGT